MPPFLATDVWELIFRISVMSRAALDIHSVASGVPMSESPGPCAGKWLLCCRNLCSSYFLMAPLAFLPSFPLFPFFGPLHPRGLLRSHASPLHVLCPRLLFSVVLISSAHSVSAPADTILSALSTKAFSTPLWAPTGHGCGITLWLGHAAISKTCRERVNSEQGWEIVLVCPVWWTARRQFCGCKIPGWDSCKATVLCRLEKFWFCWCYGNRL